MTSQRTRLISEHLFYYAHRGCRRCSGYKWKCFFSSVKNILNKYIHPKSGASHDEAGELLCGHVGDSTVPPSVQTQEPTFWFGAGSPDVPQSDLWGLKTRQSRCLTPGSLLQSKPGLVSVLLHVLSGPHHVAVTVTGNQIFP